MQAYRLETVVQKDGTLILSNLPLKAGSNIEVIILVQPVASSRLNRYPLRGKPITYLNPMEPVAQSDWSVIQ